MVYLDIAQSNVYLVTWCEIPRVEFISEGYAWRLNVVANCSTKIRIAKTTHESRKRLKFTYRRD
jgi:hypothetical protein